MEKNNLKLTDLIKQSHLQELQDSFAAATKVTTLFVDPTGMEITTPSNWVGICSLFSSCPATQTVCRENPAKIAKLAGESGYRRIFRCPNIGLTAAAVPIFVEGVYLGSWIFAQMRINELDSEQLAATARKVGIDPHELTVQLESLPLLSMQEFERLFSLAETLTKSIAEIGHNNLLLTKMNREVRGMTEQLMIRDTILTRLSQASQEALYISDFYTGEMLMVNNAYCQLAGLPMNRILGRKCWDLRGFEGGSFCPDCPRQALLDKADEPGNREVVEYYNHNFKRWLRCTHEAVTWSGGRAAQMVTQQDVTTEYEMRKRLEQMAFYDRASGLPNWNKLKDDLREAPNRAGASAICLFLSSMKTITDVYGSDAGDRIVRTLAEWLRSQVPEACEIYSLHRDEYCMIFKKYTQEKMIELAESIKERFSRPWLIQMGTNQFSFVGGISMVVLSHDVFFASQQEVLRIIGRTFDEARKKEGLLIYDEKTDRETQRSNRLRLALEDCVKRDMHGFSLVYQPIMELASGKWKGVEALCRWGSPEHGPVSPSVFIPEAEKLGLIMPIGMWVLETAIKAMKELALDEIPGFYLSVNMSPRQMMDETCADKVIELLRKYAFAGSNLNIEITESSEMTFNDFTISVIEALRAQGVTLALDDFGTGYSSFNNLKHLPVHYLKTERAFIQGIERDSYLQYFIFVLSEIAHAHGMKLVAEGVETKEQLTIARSNGADYIQGYFFSKPITVEELEKQKGRFLYQDNSHIHQRADTIDISRWLTGKSAFEFTPAIFRLLHECMKIVLRDQRLDEALQSILELMGRHFGAGRAFVFLEETDKPYTDLHEWHASGVASHKERLQSIVLHETLPNLVNAFKEEGMIVASDISLLPEGIYKELRRLGVQSTAMMPLWKGEEWKGLVGLDSDAMVEWPSDAIVMLWNMETIIATLISRAKMKEDVCEKKALLNAIFMNQSLYSYVSDPETYEILWVNERAIKQLKLDDDAVGRKCYEVMAGKSAPCANCALKRLKDMPEYSQMEQTIYNPHMDRSFACYDSLFPWVGGRLVHMCYALDITGRESLGMESCMPAPGVGYAHEA